MSENNGRASAHDKLVVGLVLYITWVVWVAVNFLLNIADFL